VEPEDECYQVEVRNCYLHDIGWNIEGTEGYGSPATARWNTDDRELPDRQRHGDGILYEDWTIHSSARYNVIRARRSRHLDRQRQHEHLRQQLS